MSQLPPYPGPSGFAQTPYGPQGFPQAPFGAGPNLQPGMQPPIALQPPPKNRGGRIAFGIFASLMVLSGLAGGVAAYVGDTMSTQAKNDVVAIARAAVSAYDKTGKLCGNALPVPATVPKGKTATPSTAPGVDFQRGSATEGWPCLGFSTKEPLRYQYEVRVGGNYKSVAKGKADPGPNAVEVSAEGDLDGDGTTGLIYYVGKIDPTTRKLVFPKNVSLSNARE